MNKARSELCIPFLGATLSPGVVCVSVEMSSGCLPLNHQQILKGEIEHKTSLPPEK